MTNGHDFFAVVKRLFGAKRRIEIPLDTGKHAKTMKKSFNRLPWVVSSVCLAGSLAAPSFATAIWVAGVATLLPFLMIELKQPVNYEFLEFDSVGFRFSRTPLFVEEVKWEEVTDVYYLRLLCPADSTGRCNT